MQTRELLAKVRKIEIRTRRLVEELTGGAWHSVYKGRGIEFSEVREYTPDDDVRDIDWNVTARMGTPYIKKYAEERELTVILAVDASASLSFGKTGSTKRDEAAEIAALLALSAIRNNDKVGLLVFTDKTELWLPPKSGKSHVLRLIREMLAFEPESKGTDIGHAMDSLARNLKRKAVIFLISDFITDKPYEKQLKVLNMRHDLAAVRITEKMEIDLPKLSMLSLEDAETGEISWFDAASSKMRKLFGKRVEEKRNSVAELFRRAKVDVVELTCGEDPSLPLMNFFRMRKRKNG
ncbi:MAG: DUF58 domain-containing protein [Lentisphaerae bacterium]|nr:DUF58 domain-containing protein [Lentisphaerota bacterium]